MYKNYPEDTLPQRIIKLRLIKSLEREEFANLLNFHFDTVEGWELHNIMPQPENIKKLCDFHNVPLEYFHDYYKVYFGDYKSDIRTWKDKNNYTYGDVIGILGISHSGFARLLSGKIHLSYEMYMKLKRLKIL